jgi:hypothetical protein
VNECTEAWNDNGEPDVAPDRLWRWVIGVESLVGGSLGRYENMDLLSKRARGTGRVRHEFIIRRDTLISISIIVV